MTNNPDQGTWLSDQLPHTWVWVSFSEFWRDFTSSQKKLPQHSYQPNGRFPVIDQGQDPVGGYSDSECLLSDAKPPVIVFGDHTRACKLVETPFIQGADGVRVLKPSPLADPKYAYYALLTLQLPDKGYSRHFKFLKASQFPLAPEPEQQRIVAKLDNLRARSVRARHELDRIPGLIERYKQAILAKAFSGELTADWRKRHSAAHALEPLLKTHSKVIGRQLQAAKNSDSSSLEALPLGWRWLQAQDVVEPEADIVYGIVQPGPKLEVGIRYVRGMDIQNGEILVDQLMKTSPAIAQRYARAALRPDDVLLGIIRDTKVAVVPSVLDGANITQGTARLRPASFIRPAYLANWLRSQFAQKWLHDHYRGIDMPGLNLRDVRRCPIPVPSPFEQDEIIRRLSFSQAWFDKIANEHSNAERLLPRLDQAILAKAFRGELVPQDATDEPASDLLERIRSEHGQSETPRRQRR